MATISDVAARAGVSTATVSRALNGKSTVDPELVARVRHAATELGYQPNGLARSLRTQQTAVFALIISDVENPFFTAVARGAEDVAQSVGHSVVLCNSDDDPDKERSYLEVAAQERTAGILLSPSGPNIAVPSLAEHQVPVVAVDRPLAGLRTDTVLTDTRQGARDATTHLLDQGYTRIACLTGPPGMAAADDRLAGYHEALRAAGHPRVDALVRRSEFRPAGAKQAATDLFTGPEPPDAVLVANNMMVLGALEAFREVGLRPGPDVGVVTFDDAPWAPLIDRPLTVVTQPAYEVGSLATRLLLARKDDPTRAPITRVLATRLIPRASSQRA